MRAPLRGQLAPRLVALFLVLSLVGCAAASLEKSARLLLDTAPQAYDTAITFAEQNQSKLSRETLLKFEFLRVNFPPAYRAFDAALAVYLDSKKKDPAALSATKAEVEALVANMQALLLLNGGPTLPGLKR